MSLSLNRLYNSTLYTSLSLPPPLFIFTFFFVTSHGTNIFSCYPHIETSPSQLASSCLPLPPDLISSQPCLRTFYCYPDIYLYHVSPPSSHSIFLSRHFTRHELRLLSPTHLFPSPSPSSPLLSPFFSLTFYSLLIFILIFIFNFHQSGNTPQ